ncbi:MAG: hypothetical protein Q7S92_01095 [Candidatus Diapherotrites archaeon]|nr:hypothetical protein [Candidatus Diapherotrites archaeon]
MTEINFSDFFKFSFSWLSKDFLKFIFIYWIIQIIFSLGILLAISAFFSSLFSSATLFSFFSAKTLGPQILSKIVEFIVLFTVWIFLFSLTLMVFQIVCFTHALKKSGLPVRPFSVKLVLRYLVLNILELLAVLFYSLDKKVLVLQWFSLFLIILSAFTQTTNPLMIVLMGVPLLFYFGIVCFNAVHWLCLSPVFLSTENAGIRSSFRKSWNLMNGKVFEAFAVFFILFIILIIVQAILSVIFSPVVDPLIQSIFSSLPKQIIIDSNFSSVFASVVTFFSTIFAVTFFYKHLLQSQSLQEPAKL